MTGMVSVFGAAAPADSFRTQQPETLQEAQLAPPGDSIGADPDLWLYRERTVAVLRRYMRLAIEVGRLPSLLGREFFRARVTYYRAQTFEDAVIFVHDVERSLENLGAADKTLIGLIALREYSQEEAARLLGCTRRTVTRFYTDALDRVTEKFLKREILTPLPAQSPRRVEPCQEGEDEDFLVSDSSQEK